MGTEGTGAPDAEGDTFLQSIGINPDAGKPTVEGGSPETGHEGTPPTQGTPEAKVTFAGREYPNLKEAEKAWKQLYGQFSQDRSRLKQLEAIWQNPSLRTAAMKDPQIAEALTKLGIVKGEVEARTEDGSPEWRDPEDEAFWQTSEGQRAVWEAQQDLRWELLDFQNQLGRPIKPEERDQIMEKIGLIGGKVSVKEAWLLTDAYQKEVQAQRKKEMDEFTKRTSKGRPSPTPGIPGAAKLNLNKPVTEMTPEEAREDMRRYLEEQM